MRRARALVAQEADEAARADGPDGIANRRDRTQTTPSTAAWRPTWPRSGSTNCGRKARKNSAVLGLRAFTITPCRRSPAAGACDPIQAPVDVALEQSPDTEHDEISAACELQHRERRRRRREDRRHAERGAGDVHERPDLHAEHRGEAADPPVTDTLRDDVEHGGPRDHDQREGGEREQFERRQRGHRERLATVCGLRLRRSVRPRRSREACLRAPTWRRASRRSTATPPARPAGSRARD